MSRLRALPVLVVAVLAAVTLSACGPKEEPPKAYSPASLAPLPAATANTPGYGHVKRVVLTPAAEQRLRVKTVTVQPGATAAETDVPITAVIYDPQGAPWVYVPDGAHSYTRQAITIGRYLGDTVVLDAGPGVGTPVVVSGAAELLGTEYGVGEE